MLMLGWRGLRGKDRALVETLALLRSRSLGFHALKCVGNGDDGLARRASVISQANTWKTRDKREACLSKAQKLEQRYMREGRNVSRSLRFPRAFLEPASRSPHACIPMLELTK